MKYIRKHTIWAALVGAISSFSSAQSAYPDKSVTIVVPFAVGGSSDSQARVVAAELSW